MSEKDIDRRAKENVDGALDMSIYVTNSTMNPDEDLGVTREYHRELYDSQTAKKHFRDDQFGDKKTTRDPITNELLHKSGKNLENKYGADRVTRHRTHVDHKDSIKSVHENINKTPGMRDFLTDDDIKGAVNNPKNLRLSSQHDNTSKQDGSDIERAFNKDNGLSMRQRETLVKDKIEADVSVYGKLAGKATVNVGREFAKGAKDTVANAAIPLSADALWEVIAVVQGKKDAKEAAKDIAETTVKVGITGGANRVLVDALTQEFANSNSDVLKTVAERNQVAQMIAVSVIVAQTANKYVKGEIDEEELLSEVGEKGIMIAAGTLGKYGVPGGAALIAGLSMGKNMYLLLDGNLQLKDYLVLTGTDMLKVAAMLPAISAVVGPLFVAGMLVGMGHTLLKSIKTQNRAYKKELGKKNSVLNQALSSMQTAYDDLDKAIKEQYDFWDQSFDEGFRNMLQGVKNNDFEDFAGGLDTVLNVFGSHALFKTMDEFDDFFFDDDAVLVL